MPITKIQDPEFTVGNASRNLPRDVKYVKDLLFAIPPGVPGALTADERSTIDPASTQCEKAMVKALARIQNEFVPSEKASGGRVVAWSNTLALLEKNGMAAQAYAAWDAGSALVASLVQGAGVALDAARASAFGGVELKKVHQVSGTAGKRVSGKIKADGDSVLKIDIAQWIETLKAHKTPYKVTGGVGAQGGVAKWGAGGGTMVITDTNTQEEKTYGMYFGAVGASLSKFSFSFATGGHPSAPITHIYKGPLRTKPVDFDSFGGPFVALSGGGAVLGGRISASLTIYFLGFSLLSIGQEMNLEWDILQGCAGITIIEGTSSGVTDSQFDYGVQCQTGKLIGEWTDFFRN